MTKEMQVLVGMGWRAFRPTVAVYVLGSVGYMFLLLWLYPSIVHAPGLESVLATLPKSLTATLGLTAGFANPLAYLTSEYYGTIDLWALMIFTVVGVVRLLAQGPDRGFAWAWLAGPVSRAQWIMSQGFVFILGLFVFTLVGMLSTPVALAIWDRGQHPTPEILVALNLLSFLLFFALAGMTAVCASAFRDDDRALNTAGAIMALEYLLSLVGGLTPHLVWLRRLSLFGWYRPADIVAHGWHRVWPGALGLFFIGTLLWIAAIWLFRRRDLSL